MPYDERGEYGQELLPVLQAEFLRTEQARPRRRAPHWYAGRGDRAPSATRLQEYVHEGHEYFGILGLRSSGASARMTPDELAAWLARRQSPPKRCKLCEPALPGADGSQASDVETGTQA